MTLNLERKLWISCAQRIVLKNFVKTVETIERMDEEIEFKYNKIQVLEKELKDVNHHDKQRILK